VPRKYLCQKIDETGKRCGLECTYIGEPQEYAVLKTEKLTRKPVGVKRAFWVNCPVHGRVAYEVMGHHVTIGWKKKAKRSGSSEK
jgi:hypothetical protein